jgi:hypothetical protein
MSFRFRRRSDHFNSPHERARRRAAERLDGPLGLAENEWLERHLAECGACRTIAEDYLTDRSELRSLGRQTVEPPRDLWARTAAAIEQEAAGTAKTRRSAAPRRRPSAVPLGALAGLMVVAVVFGATLLSGRPAPTVNPRATGDLLAASVPPASPEAPTATPWIVAPNDVGWVAKVDDGTLAYYGAQFREVCDDEAVCELLDSTPQPLDVPAAPREAIISEDQATLAVVNRASDGGDSIVVVAVPTPQTVGGGGTGGPSDPPAATPPPTGTPRATAGFEPSPSLEPTDVPAGSPAITEPPVTEPPVTAPPATPDPGDPVEIAEDVVVVGETAFSADGARFAFSARPADGSSGPDIYVWTQGDLEATRITSDGRSVFAGWIGDLVLGSRAVDLPMSQPSVDPTGSPPAAPILVAARPETFAIDPATAAEAIVEGSMWRPAVDPTGTYAVYWDGTIQLDPTTNEYRPADGRLVVGAWPELPVLPAAEEEPGASLEPEARAPDASAEPSATPEPVGDGDVAVLHDGPVVEWEARWDETGARLGLWIADADDPTLGRLSLYLADEDGALVVDEPALSGEWARPGFAIGEDHLAWATREGQDGKGSHVKVVAWTDDGIGAVETKPGEDVLVVQR